MACPTLIAEGYTLQEKFSRDSGVDILMKHYEVLISDKANEDMEAIYASQGRAVCP